MFKFMYNPLSDMPCYKALLFFKFMLIQKIFSPPWQFLISLLTLHSSLLFSLRMFFPFFLDGDYFTEYSTQSCVIDSHKSILTPMILLTIPFLICLNILFFFFFFWLQLHIKQKLSLNMLYTFSFMLMFAAAEPLS